MIALALTATSASALSIVIRADVPDARYLEFGAKFKDTVATFPWVRETGEFRPASGTGTLVASQWVLTAAHVATAVKPGHPDNPARSPDIVRIAGKDYAVEQVYLHPESIKGITKPGADAALVKLATPVEGGKPACLYPAKDEIGKIATIAGFGTTGTNLTGGEIRDYALRAATTMFQETKLPSWVINASAEETLSTSFRDPADPEATPLEGSAAPGDSGGPAFLTHEGKLCVAGIAAAGVPAKKMVDRAAAVSVAKVDPRPYKISGTYGRVSLIRGWAMDVMNGKVAP
jgi:V8-like Glu-specific endopeptidase